MIVGLCRLLAGLVGWLLLVIVGVAGLAAAVLSIEGGDGTLSYANGAQLVGLPELRDTVGGWLDGLAGEGTDTASLLAGLGGVALGAVLLIGALVPRRDRLVVVEESDAGRLAMRRRAAAGALTATLEGPRDVERAHTRVRPSRRGTGGSARVRLEHAASADGSALTREARGAADPVAQDLRLKLTAQTKTSRRVR